MNRTDSIRGKNMSTTMKRRGVAGVISVGLVAGALAMSPAQAESATFAVTTSSPKVGVGQQVTVTVAATSVQDVYAYDLDLDYDESALAYVEGSATTDVSGSTYAEVQDGDLSVLHTKLGTSPAASGDVTLVTATFTALKSGPTSVSVPSLELVGARGESRAADVEGATLTVDAQPAPTAVTAPRISGTRQVGRVLSVSPGTWSVRGATTSVQWLRNGKTVRGATKTSYRLTPADFGASISARVTAKAPDRPAGSAVAKAVKVTQKATSRTTVKAKSSVKARGTWKATVSVKAAGVSPRGTLRVVRGGKTLRTVKGVDGRATVALKLGTKRGRTSVRFVYVPQSGVKGSSRTVTGRVR